MDFPSTPLLLIVVAIHVFACMISGSSGSITYETTNQRNSSTVVDLTNCMESPDVLSQHRNECCSLHYQRYRRKWYGGGNYLTTYLSTLKDWDCKEFHQECEKPNYGFTPFTELVYKLFCSRERLIEKCTPVLFSITKNSLNLATMLGGNRFADNSETIWLNLTSSLQPNNMCLETLNEPCVQIAMFDRPSGGVGRFHELIQPNNLFCDITWFGYDINTAMERDISPWTTYSVSCKSSMIISIIVESALSLGIILSNVVILSVYKNNLVLYNSQTIYKVSVATSDLLTGLITVPNMIVFQYLTFLVPQKMGEVMSSEGDLIRREPGGRVTTYVTTPHISVAGFFTTLSLFVSIYSLLFASFDRFWAVFRPLNYEMSKATRFAKVSTGITWIFAILMSALPFIFPVLQYHLAPSLLALSVGLVANILQAVAFAIPLLIMIVANILTFRSARQHSRSRRKLGFDKAKNDSPRDNIENRLRKILALMVGVFTLCVLPPFMTSICSAAISNINFSIPEKLNAHSAVTFGSVGYSFALLLLSNSLWNVFIYSTRAIEFRRAAKSLRFVRFASSSLATALSSVRKISQMTLVHHRRKSSTLSELNSSSVASKLPNNTPSTSQYESITISTPNRTHSKGVTHENEGNCTSFDSFAVDVGADRFELSVMENIPEQ